MKTSPQKAAIFSSRFMDRTTCEPEWPISREKIFENKPFCEPFRSLSQYESWMLQVAAPGCTK